ncbi:acyl-CoA thioesterase, partial [Neisseria sp. P0022.S009]
YFHMCAVEDGEPVAVPPLEINAPPQRCRYEKAKKRKALSLRASNEVSCIL